MLKNIILSVIVIGLVVLGGYYLFSDNKNSAGSVVVQPVETSTDTATPIMEDGTLPATETTITTNSSTDSRQVKSYMVTIDTNYGKIVFETYDADAPNTVSNFVTLADKGFYDGLVFHRAIKGFMIQGGDPSGNGTGGPGYKFDDELNPATDSYKAGYKKGVVAIANAGPNTNGSQFFIMTEDYPLPNNYTIFGKVVSGQEVVDKIANLPTDPNDKPISSVIMKTVTVE